MEHDEKRLEQRPRKPYAPPVIEATRSFETLAMACTKQVPDGEGDECNGGPLSNS